jgi:hypothetical protein
MVCKVCTITGDGRSFTSRDDICDNCLSAQMPTEDEIYAALEVLSRTERYSVKDNETDDWIV